MSKNKKVLATGPSARVEVTDWATAEFWVEFFVKTDDESYEVAVQYSEYSGWDAEITDSVGNEYSGAEFAHLLGYDDDDLLFSEMCEGMFSVPEKQFALTVGGKKVTA